MPRYQGLDPKLKREVVARDNERCRWCGATNRGLDAHHIEYRRGFSYDVVENLISLCRLHHNFVHGIPNPRGDRITKHVAQSVLKHLVEHPGTTGISVLRRMRRQWALDGLCGDHGEDRESCSDCRR